MDRPDQPWWFTPGGGLESGEASREAAARESGEEIGFAVRPVDLGGVVFRDHVAFFFDGRLLRQNNHLTC